MTPDEIAEITAQESAEIEYEIRARHEPLTHLGEPCPTHSCCSCTRPGCETGAALGLLSMERDGRKAAEARAADLEAERDVLLRFAQMSFAAEYWFASGHPHLPPEMAGDWEAVCSQVRAIIAAQAAPQGEGE